MNERIEELLGQAYDEAVPETWTTLSSEQLGRIYEKFAELIVQECIGCCEQVISDPVPESVDTWLNGGEQCIQEIKKHFGVEE
jgi:hypothetical protein